jgi:hypothetical protein
VQATLFISVPKKIKQEQNVSKQLKKKATTSQKTYLEASACAR